MRILGFSPDGIAECSITLDYGTPILCTQVNDSLFVVEWDPKLYSSGSHTIRVRMIDGLGREREVERHLHNNV